MDHLKKKLHTDDEGKTYSYTHTLYAYCNLMPLANRTSKFQYLKKSYI